MPLILLVNVLIFLCNAAFRVNERLNAFFCLQKRRGHGEGRGFAARVIGTLDNMRDSRPPPYRILLQTVSYEEASRNVLVTL